MTWGKYLLINVGVKPGHVLKNCLDIAFENVERTGEKHDACKYAAKSVCVCFFFIITAMEGIVFTKFAFIYVLLFWVAAFCIILSSIL